MEVFGPEDAVCRLMQQCAHLPCRVPRIGLVKANAVKREVRSISVCNPAAVAVSQLWVRKLTDTEIRMSQCTRGVAGHHRLYIIHG